MIRWIGFVMMVVLSGTVCSQDTFAVALAPSARLKAKDDPQAVEKVVPPKAVAGEVDECVKQLGAERFKDRRRSTRRLVEIGRTAVTKVKHEHNPAVIPKVKTHEDYVCERMLALRTHPDPEVSQRAKEVLDALQPYRNIDLSKYLYIEHPVDHSSDTIDAIANAYDVETILIKAANPGLRSDADLASFETIDVPVLEEDVEEPIDIADVEPPMELIEVDE